MDVMLEGKDDAKGSKASRRIKLPRFFGLPCIAQCPGSHPHAAAKRPKVLDNRRGFSRPGEPASVHLWLQDLR